MFMQAIDPRLTAHAVFTAERNARTKYAQYNVLFSIDGVLADTVFIDHKEDETRRYTVRLDAQFHPVACTCKYAEKNAICLHQFIVARKQEEASEEAMVADLYEREEAREFMLETSREHAVGFSAEMLADTAASFGS